MNGQIFEIELLGNHICYIWCSDTKLTVNEIQNTVSTKEANLRFSALRWWGKSKLKS